MRGSGRWNESLCAVPRFGNDYVLDRRGVPPEKAGSRVESREGEARRGMWRPGRRVGRLKETEHCQTRSRTFQEKTSTREKEEIVLTFGLSSKMLG